MTRPRIFAAAAALHEFSTEQLAAYCGAEPRAVDEVLSAAPDLVERTVCRWWRVVDLTAIRAAAARDGGSARLRVSRAGGNRTTLADRVARAEAILVECGEERSPGLRQVMTATARNTLLQVVARVVPSEGPWWSVRTSGAVLRAVESAAGDPGLSMPRLRADLALATLIEAEAAGEPVTAEYLTRTAIDLSQLAGSGLQAHLDRLFMYFVDLASTMAEPAGLTTQGKPAPERVLVALAWRRARMLGSVDLARATSTFVAILRQLSRRPRSGDEHALDFYRLVERLPDGGNRVVVYHGLLDLLPHGTRWSTGGEHQPGVLVEAITDVSTSNQLEDMAWRLRDGLERSPFRSESALIGQAAHVLRDVAVMTATRDRDVLPRSDLVRRELLELAGAPV